MTADQMHSIIDEHRDGPKIAPRTSVPAGDDVVDQAEPAVGIEPKADDQPEVSDGSA